MHYYCRFIPTVLAALVLTWTPIHAQEVGDRLRIQTSEEAPVVGTVLKMNPHAIRLVTDKGEKEIPRHQIKKLEKSYGMSTRETDWMFYGIAAGMVIGGIGGGLLALSIGGETTTTETTGDPAVEEEENKAAILLPIGAVVGAVVPGYFPFGKLGKRIGSTMTKEEWKLITPQVKASLSHDHALIVASIHF